MLSVDFCLTNESHILYFRIIHAVFTLDLVHGCLLWLKHKRWTLFIEWH